MWNEKKYVRHYEIDQKEFPVVVIESDDWGACELVPEYSMLERYNATLQKYGKGKGWNFNGFNDVVAGFSSCDNVITEKIYCLMMETVRIGKRT